MNIKNRISFSFLLIVMLAFAPSAFAQRVSADLNGLVQDSDGNPVIGASVEIVHVPSGTARTAVTQDGGRFAARGLRVGGPYTITASQNGATSQPESDVYLNLGDPGFVSLTVVSDSADLDRMEVVGSAIDPTFDPDRMGSSTVVEKGLLEQLPSVDRSFNSIARLDPRAVIVDQARGELSVAGSHNRYNSFTIDGVSANDEFGLNANGQPGVVGQPFSLDWLEQIVIQTTPYDVSQAGFTGAQISAVTKSGGNEFEGNVFYTYRDQDLTGDNENDVAFPDFKGEFKGATLSGPIIKDRLFFFLGYEEEERSFANAVGFAGSGASTVFGDADTPAEIQRAIDAAVNVYGFDPGSLTPGVSSPLGDEKLVAKIDWNISDLHRAAIRYSKVDSFSPDIDRDRFDYALSSHFHTNSAETEQISAQWFADWSANFSTELRYGVQDYFSAPTVAQRLPEIEIDVRSASGRNLGDLLMGTERFRHANVLDTQVETLFGKATYFTGLHTFDFGFEWEGREFDNLFVFDNLGRYRFDNIDAFVNQDYSRVRYAFRTSSDPSNPDLPRAAVGYDIFGLFVQDTWQVSPNLTLQYGVRFDKYDQSDRPVDNPGFQSAFGLSNQGTLDGESAFQPRIGFNWSPNTSFRSQLRGGIGLFRGSIPGVWIANAFTNSGGTISVFQCSRQQCLDLDPNFQLVLDPDNQPQIGGSSNAAQDVDVVADGFNLPTDLKANLAWDMDVPWWDNTTFTAEVNYTDANDAIQYEHLNLGTPTGSLPDGRPAYWADINAGSGSRANRNSAFNDVLLLTNTDGGDRFSTTLSLQKRWTFDGGSFASLRGSYTRADSTDVNPGTSSRAISNWQNRSSFQPNEDVTSTSNFEIKDRFTLLFDSTFNIFETGATKFTAFFEHRSGRPFSWTFNNDANGDNVFGNDLLYVPNSGEVVFTNPTDEAAFFQLVADTPALAAAQGSVISRNTDRSPDVNQMDIRLTQEFGFGRLGAQVYFEILNFTNLLNKDWGHVDQVNFPYRASPVSFQGVTDDGRYIYRLDNTDGFTTRQDGIGESRWRANLGFRLNF